MIKISPNKGFYYYKHRKNILVVFLPQKLCFKSLPINAFIKHKIDKKVTNTSTYCNTTHSFFPHPPPPPLPLCKGRGTKISNKTC